jgi:flagellar basal body-associated protein FliL
MDGYREKGEETMPARPSLRRIFSLCSAAALAYAVCLESSRAADEPGQTAQHKTTQSESYVIIEPLYASILDGARPRGLLMVELGLDVPDGQLRDKINRSLPTLRDAYVRSLLIYASTAVRPWRQPSVEDIANRLQTITDRMVGRQGARVLMAQTAIRLTR